MSEKSLKNKLNLVMMTTDIFKSEEVTKVWLGNFLKSTLTPEQINKKGLLTQQKNIYAISLLLKWFIDNKELYLKFPTSYLFLDWD